MRVENADDSVTGQIFQNTCELVLLAAPHPVLIPEVQIGPDIGIYFFIVILTITRIYYEE